MSYGFVDLPMKGMLASESFTLNLQLTSPGKDQGGLRCQNIRIKRYASY